MGFRTLTIQQRSSEVWKLLGDVKTQFSKYSQVLATIRKRLEQATQTVDAAATRTRAIERQLKKVETLEEVTAPGTLHLIASEDEEVINACA
jgi:DNA recombination protein RmuC